MTTTTVAATPTAPAARTARPVAARNTAARREQTYRTVQLVLFTAGAVLMPLGIVAICLGWYGTAHSHYAYDQTTYLVSGGLLGLGLVLLGGFLYFGAWLAKLGADQRDSARQLADTVLVLADLVHRQAAPPLPVSGAAAAAEAPGFGAEPVLAGAGTTVHRRDCPLVGHRADLHSLSGTETGLTSCRVCRPAAGA